MTYKLISEMAVGEQLEQVCLVASVESKTTKQNKPFTRVTIKDSSGTLPINIWQVSADDTDLKAGVFAVFKIKIEDFKGSKSATATPPMIVKTPEDLTPYQNQKGLKPEEAEAYYAMLLAAKSKVVDKMVKTYLDVVFDDPKTKAEFIKAPASVTNRGAYEGGLVEHVAKVLMNAEFLVQTQCQVHIMGSVNVDIVIVGALMHDLGKTIAYGIDENGNPFTTRKGMLLEHLPMSYAMSTLAFAKAVEVLRKEVPEEVKDHINHCILAHHGQLAYGSPVTPKSLEAQIVHMADMADSTTSNYAEPTKLNAGNVDEEGFVEGSRFSSRKLFIGTQ